MLALLLDSIETPVLASAEAPTDWLVSVQEVEVASSAVALVTGGASGIGAETVRRLARRTAGVVIADLNQELARALAEELSDAAACLAVRCDVTNPDDAARACSLAADLPGELGIVVNCAGLPGASKRLERFPLAEWEQVHQVNTMGVVNIMRAAVPVLRARKQGCIVNVASIAGINGSRGQAAYSGAKAAVIGITRAVAKELLSDGIRVNAVAPGFISTPMTDEMPADTRSAWRVEELAIGGRFGEAAEVAAAIDFLASDDASYITGVVLTVDGGFTLGRP